MSEEAPGIRMASWDEAMLFAKEVAQASGWDDEDRELLVCSGCGSDDIVWDAWVSVNYPKRVETFDECYCRGCECSTSPVPRSEVKA